jgi:excisionase family DNA binding protein
MTQQPPEPDVMRTAAEVQEQLGIKKSKFYELIRTGELTAIDINGVGKRQVGETGPRRSIRVAQSEIERFKAARRIAA